MIANKLLRLPPPLASQIQCRIQSRKIATAVRIETLPFTIGESFAATLAEAYTYILVGRARNIPSWRMALHYVLPGLAKLPRLNLRSLKPVLVPTFRLDLLLRIKTERGPRVSKCNISMIDGCMPAVDFAPLDRLPLSVPINPADLEEFSPAKHCRNPIDDNRVLILPFQRSPAQLLDYIRTIPPHQMTLTDHTDNGPPLKVLTGETEIHLAAAYPVYVPVFLCEWDAVEDHGTSRVTSVLAGLRSGFPYAMLGACHEAGALNWLAHQSLTYGNFRFSGTPGDGPLLDTLIEQSTQTTDWWDQTDTEDMSKPNFLSFSEYAAKNREFIQASSSLLDAHSQLDSIRNLSGKAMGLQIDIKKMSFKQMGKDEIEAQLETSIEQLEKDVADNKPDWMQESP